MPLAFLRRETISLSFVPALGALAVVLVGTIVSVLIQYDRRPPYEYRTTTISPLPAIEGGRVTVTRHGVWRRRCVGEVFREIVKPSGTIASYRRAWTRLPTEDEIDIGTTAENSFRLPVSMVPVDVDVAEATFRGLIRFPDCGLTSRWWPLEIPFQQITFKVRKAPQ